MCCNYMQGKIKGFPIWSDPNQVVVFLEEKSTPPLACPSIVNAKHLGMYLKLFELKIFHLLLKHICVHFYKFTFFMVG